MSAQIGGIPGNGHVVTEQRWYFSVTARADIGLQGLIGLDMAHFDWPIKSIPQSKARRFLLRCHKKPMIQPTKAQMTKAAAARMAATTKT